MDDSPKNETVPLFKGGALSTSMWITFVWTESKLIIDPFMAGEMKRGRYGFRIELKFMTRNWKT
jgi:hypothetical protein